MILYKGIIYEDSKQESLFTSLENDCYKTINSNTHLQVEQVINACDALYHKLIKGEFDDIILPFLHLADISKEYFLEIANMFSAESLRYKCEIELDKEIDNLPPLQDGTKRVRRPLGILFHIAAGNVDGLPAYSVIEGILAGNINILKLPSGDSGLSIKLLQELIKVEPILKDYIYVFDVPSTEIESIKFLASIADGVVVWGGDEANIAARNFVDIKTKIISWGHKLSFAYVDNIVKDEELYKLAKHICLTNQVFCSSCQGIFVNTSSFDELITFGKRFFEILKEVNKEVGLTDIGMRGKNTIQLYSDQLEENNQNVILSSCGVSVVIKHDHELELSYLFRNVWIKALPSSDIISLKKHKNHLQSVALLVDFNKFDALANLFSYI